MRRSPQGGYILVAVLSVMLLLTGFLAAGSVLVRSALHGAAAADASLMMEGLTQGGLDLSAYQLFISRLPPWSIDGRPIRLAGGTITPHLVDEAGKVDLNGSDPKVLTNVFAGAGLDQETAGALVSKIVAARGVRKAAGLALPPLPTVSPTGVTLPFPVQTQGASDAQKRRRGFQSIDQLRDLVSLSPSDYRELVPRLTVYNPDGKVNVLTASPDVLAAIPNLTAPAIKEIMALRDADPIGRSNSVQALLKDAAPYAKTSYGPAYAIRIDVQDGSGQKRSSDAVIAASKVLDEPYLVLSWRN